MPKEKTFPPIAAEDPADALARPGSAGAGPHPCAGFGPDPRVRREILRARMEARFQYYPPKPERIPDFGAIRDKAKELAMVIADLCPESREQSVALTHLDEVVFWANAAIAREGKGA